MTTLEWLEALSYVVTIIGLPFAIIVFLQERRKNVRTTTKNCICSSPTSMRSSFD